jgi:ribosomal-protein-alanine N-acetyltransferase
VIAQVGAAHAAWMAALHAAAMPAGQAWGADAFATLLGQPGVTALAAADHGLLLLRTVAEEAEILTLAVHPSARRRGVGRALVQAAIRTAGPAAALFLEVAEHNRPARLLYAGAGFRPVGRRRAYYADGSDALVLRREPRP